MSSSLKEPHWKLVYSLSSPFEMRARTHTHTHTHTRLTLGYSIGHQWDHTLPTGEHLLSTGATQGALEWPNDPPKWVRHSPYHQRCSETGHLLIRVLAAGTQGLARSLALSNFSLKKNHRDCFLQVQIPNPKSRELDIGHLGGHEMAFPQVPHWKQSTDGPHTRKHWNGWMVRTLDPKALNLAWNKLEKAFSWWNVSSKESVMLFIYLTGWLSLPAFPTSPKPSAICPHLNLESWWILPKGSESGKHLARKAEWGTHQIWSVVHPTSGASCEKDRDPAMFQAPWEQTSRLAPSGRQNPLWASFIPYILRLPTNPGSGRWKHVESL